MSLYPKIDKNTEWGNLREIKRVSYKRKLLNNFLNSANLAVIQHDFYPVRMNWCSREHFFNLTSSKSARSFILCQLHHY